MKAFFDIFRKHAEADQSYRQTFEIEGAPGMVVLDAFHQIQENLDPSFAYRYSCRGAICGSCAVRINGTAMLACKTQVQGLAEKGTIVVDPLGNLPPIKDLVVENAAFWAEYAKTMPYLARKEDQHDQSFTWSDKMSVQQLDQFDRCLDCIKCAACFSDCPKRAQDTAFIGPAACVQVYRYYFDPRDADHPRRVDFSKSPGGVVACDSFGNCVKVCPKDVRPLRAINFIKQDLGVPLKAKSRPARSE